ncbi:MAG TPA: class I SAM-dependent methyltransferase, partial [Dermatophilaceae bacterium]
ATSALLAGAVAALVARRRIGQVLLVGAGLEAFRAGTYLYATLRGKLVVWGREIDALDLAGTEQVLDLGCGRGAVLLTIARRLTTGTAIGLDSWRAKDQSGNTEAATRRNAAAEGLTDRVDLVTGDLRALPFDDASFDLVVSSLALHNIPGKDDRENAVMEALRVLRPGGRLLLADALHTDAYATTAREAGALAVAVRPLGWRVWYGGPWFGLSMVTARKQ